MVRGEPPITGMQSDGEYAPYIPPRRNRGEHGPESDYRGPVLIGAGLLLVAAIGGAGYAYGRGDAPEATPPIAPPVAASPSTSPSLEPEPEEVRAVDEPTAEPEPEPTTESEPTKEPKQTRVTRDITIDQDGKVNIDADSPLGKLYANGKGNVKITVKERGGDKVIKVCGSVTDLVLGGKFNSEGVLGEGFDLDLSGDNCVEYKIE